MQKLNITVNKYDKVVNKGTGNIENGCIVMLIFTLNQ